MPDDAPTPPLDGFRVVDLSSWIAGGYATRLLADGGADVVKVEPPAGDPLRRWSASGAPIEEGVDGPLFAHLAASKRSIVLDPADDAELDELLAAADAVVWSAGRPDRPAPTFRSPGAVLAAHPHLTVTAISPFGLDGPWQGRPVSEFTLQAWSGGVVRLARGRPDLAPTFVGGQIGEWMAGLHAAIGTLAARRQGGPGRIVDVSMLEALAATLTYHPVTFFDVLDRPIRVDRFVPTPGVAAAKDGMVGLGTGTGQQWFDFCAMVGRPEWTEDRSYLLDRTSLAPEIDAWVADHTVAEITELATAFRLPNAPIVHGANAVGIDHLRERETFAVDPDRGIVTPRPPWRFAAVPLADRTPAPALGSSAPGAIWTPRPDPEPRAGSGLPFAGLRVLDMTSFWAGPMTGNLLGMLGAEVLHLESPTRPDGVRLVGGVPDTEPDHLERSPIFAALNTDKSGLAIDVRSEAGGAVLRELLATCDVLVENSTPRVLDQLGLDADTLGAINPRLITVRMPGFGLDGPWREVSAFAFVIEDASGLTWLSGHPEVPPIEPYSIGDPNAGLHALLGLQLALEHRDRHGVGGVVEASMLDAALNITAEQVVEHSAHGTLLHRAGNRGPLAAPQGIYRVDGLDPYGQDDSWVALAVTTDRQWDALVGVLGDPDWARDPALATADGRRAAHDRIDEALAGWFRARRAEDAVERLLAAGIPTAPVVHPHHQVDLSPMQHRRHFEDVDHPVTGVSRVATLAMTFSDGPERWHRRPAPLLGQHTEEVLRGLGLAGDRIDALRADGVII